LKTKEKHSYNILLAAPETEFSQKFVQGMANRMAVSFHKYGPVSSGYPERLDAIASLQQRIQKYVDTGNTEFLMDVANFAMIEYLFPGHPEAHFAATDSDQSPGRTFKDGNVSDEHN
jgi:hypothetical protein